METKANYRLVGSFVLLGFLSVLLFVIWIGRSGFGQSFNEYDIYFTGSVSGLKKGSVVHYRGVPIGQVNNIVIDPENIQRIRVHVLHDKYVPLKVDSLASLETQGFTGLSYIQINGSKQESANLTAQEGQPYPVIPSKSSLLEEVTDSLPAVLKRVSSLVEEIRDVFSDDNRAAFSKTIKNIEAISDYVAPNNKDSILIEFHAAISTLNDTLLELTKTSREFREIMADNRAGLKDFSVNGLSALSKFLNEGRDALSTVRRIGEAIERSPSRFFYNDPKQGVQVR